MHRFKRYYLLASLVFAFSVPFITFTEYVEPLQPIESFQTSFEPVFIPQIVEEPQINYVPIILWSIYGLGVLLFLTKFILNLSRIFNKIRKNETQPSQSFIYVLLNDLVIPHSFFSYIFLNKKGYKSEQIPKEVLIHEQTHAKQKHSIDVLAIEVLQIVFWFHPLVYIIKHAIKLNHEFLADEAVINQGVEPSAYQQLLIAFSSNASKQVPIEIGMASAINYSSIKKRFTVMKTHTSKRNIWLRSIVLLPLIAFSIYGFSEKKEVLRPLEDDLKETHSDYTARSISIEILEDGTYTVDGIAATKNTLIEEVNKLHQDITTEIRNHIMNIHVTSSSKISNEETWFIYNTLLDYGFYRLVTPEQEVVKGKGNTPFAIEQTQQKANSQDSIPVLIINQDPLQLTLNGKLTSLEELNADFNEITNGKVSDLKIETEEMIKMSFLETISEILKPNVSKIIFRAESGIIGDIPFNNSAITKDLVDKPLLKLTDDVKLVCDNCTLDKGLVKNASVVISNNENVESFTVKIPSNPSVLVKGNTFNKEVLKQIESMNNNDQLMIFAIKTNTKNIEGSMLINVKTQQEDSSKKVKVIKGGDWKDVESHLKQDKKVINDIHIHIDKNEKIFLNNKNITLNTLADKVNELNSHLTTDEKRKYSSANITYDDNTQIDLVNNVTTILVKNCNVFSTSSSNIETQKKFNLKNVNSNPYAGKSIEEAKEIYENETLDFSIKEQPKNSPWSISTEVNEVTFIELDEELVEVKITEVELKEYNSMVKKFNALPKDKRIIKLKDFERMSYIYSHLSEEQKKRAEPYPDFYKELSKD
jgi:biopolymer transport protein ExbD